MKTRLAELGGVVLPLSPAEFGRFVAEDTERWAKVGVSFSSQSSRRSESCMKLTGQKP
jgi:hypothetical protein